METKDPKEQLVDDIKSKFGSIQRFINKHGLNEGCVRVNLRRSNPAAITMREQMRKLVDAQEEPLDFLIKDSDREAMRLSIAKDYHNVTKFTNKYPQFSDSYMSYLLRPGGVKYKKGKAKEVMKILNLMEDEDDG